jgi:tyrosyl-DNA phosphodiesterase-1
MTSPRAENTPLAKRRKLNADTPDEALVETQRQVSLPTGLSRPISPPLCQRKSPEPAELFRPTWSFDDVPKQTPASRPGQPATTCHKKDEDEAIQCLPSSVQLTRIEKLPAQQNVDTMGLADLLGDPLIKECWNFNFLFDIDFVM